jgi:hypothetical protein
VNRCTQNKGVHNRAVLLFLFILIFNYGLNMQKVPALKGRLSFSLCFSKHFRIATALSVNFKKGLLLDFLADVSPILPDDIDDWACRMLTHTNNTLNGQPLMRIGADGMK